MTTTIRVMIVDDELPARRKLSRFLRRDPRVELVAEAGDGEEAVREIEKHNPDLVFLDIEMPGMNGFEVLEVLGDNRPQVVFTTAYNQFAIQAFEVRALDYLLKPFEEARFREALDRAIKERSRAESSDPRIEELLNEVRNRPTFLRRILLRTDGRIIFVDTRQILWVESEEKYVRLHLDGASYIHRETMNHLENRLDPSVFVRVHRQAIVNMEYVRELESLSHGDYQIVLKKGARIPLGRTYRERFLTNFSEPPHMK